MCRESNTVIPSDATVRDTESFFELDNMIAVINSDGPKLSQDVLAQQAVELRADALREVAVIHDRNGLRKQEPPGDFQVHTQTQGIAHDARPSANGFDPRRSQISAEFSADDRIVGAGVEQQRRGSAVHFDIDQDQRVHRAKREKNDPCLSAAGARKDRKRREGRGQCTRAAAERNTQNASKCPSVLTICFASLWE